MSCKKYIYNNINNKAGKFIWVHLSSWASQCDILDTTHWMSLTILPITEMLNAFINRIICLLQRLNITDHNLAPPSWTAQIETPIVLLWYSKSPRPHPTHRIKPNFYFFIFSSFLNNCRIKGAQIRLFFYHLVPHNDLFESKHISTQAHTVKMSQSHFQISIAQKH